MKILENSDTIAQIESRLNKYDYLSRHPHPGCSDGQIFTLLDNNKRFPDQKNSPKFFHWFILMKQFSKATIQRWILNQVFFDPEDSLLQEFANKFPLIKKDSHTQVGADLPLEKACSTYEALTIEIKIKRHNAEEMDSLRRMLGEDRAQLTQSYINGGILLRIVCKMEPSRLDILERKISNCIQYEQFSVKRKDMKGKGSFVVG